MLRTLFWSTWTFEGSEGEGSEGSRLKGDLSDTVMNAWIFYSPTIPSRRLSIFYGTDPIHEAT